MTQPAAVHSQCWQCAAAGTLSPRGLCTDARHQLWAVVNDVRGPHLNHGDQAFAADAARRGKPGRLRHWIVPCDGRCS